MKRILYACALLAALAGCSKEEAGIEPQRGDTGILRMNISTTRTDATDDYDPMDRLTVRLYNAEGALLRKYTAREDLPGQLELLAGDYRVAVEAGEAVAASRTVRFYQGEERFAIAPGGTTPVEVKCQLQNTVVEVAFDESVAANFGSAFHALAAIGEEAGEAQETAGTALRFTADGRGYFTLPDGAETLSWSFSGEHPERGTIVKQGSQPLRTDGGRYRYRLTFRFSEDLPGYIEGVAVTVDPSTDDYDDTIIFSPDPTIEPEGFDPAERQDYLPGITGDRIYRITTVAPISRVEVTIDGTVYPVFGTSSAADGIAVEQPDDTHMTVALTEAFFAGRTGGEHTVTISVADTDGGALSLGTPFRLPGLLPVTAADYDLWSNTVTLRALVFGSDSPNVRFGLRTQEGEWQEAAGAPAGEDIYAATIGAQWQTSVNEAGLTVHTPVAGTGVFADTDYEYSVEIDGSRSTAAFATDAGNEAIYNAGMEYWSTYKVTGSSITGGTVPYPNESSDKEWWVGGNNKTTSSLCTGSYVEGCRGERCAALVPTTAVGVFAAGNLFTGTFDCGTGMLDTFGFARFGVKYPFTARPRALQLHAKAIASTVTNAGGPLTTSDIDPARIYVCVIDWSQRHAVKSGASRDESTFWDPVKTSSLAEGAILGYGSLMITESFDWEDIRLPIQWYDHVSAPAAGNYSLVISCVTSNYGDYVAGSTNNRLYVEDFAWVY